MSKTSRMFSINAGQNSVIGPEKLKSRSNTAILSTGDEEEGITR